MELGPVLLQVSISQTVVKASPEAFRGSEGVCRGPGQPRPQSTLGVGLEVVVLLAAELSIGGPGP